ncbi:hypothetical protein [Pengzhenrongella sp.]|jgi:hypothetical protein|uniref:hypothetical protein n=1 Tax=Pengzhenrongella sp. TaxID=2888820 RepID=UPI002F920573
MRDPANLHAAVIAQAGLADGARVQVLQVRQPPVGFGVVDHLAGRRGKVGFLCQQQIETARAFEVGGEGQRHLVGVVLGGPVLLILLSARLSSGEQPGGEQHDADEQGDERAPTHDHLSARGTRWTFDRSVRRLERSRSDRRGEDRRRARLCPKCR